MDENIFYSKEKTRIQAEADAEGKNVDLMRQKEQNEIDKFQMDTADRRMLDEKMMTNLDYNFENAMNLSEEPVHRRR